MKHFRLKNLWKAMTVGQAGGAIEADASGGQSSPDSSPSRRPDPVDLGFTVVTSLPGPPRGQLDGSVSDRDKTGATLLFSGVFLGLVGMTFTAMGWINYEESRAFEWTQFLGPVLLSVGATFVFISICKFRMISCLACGQQEDDGGSDGRGAEDDSELSRNQSFVFAGINQPITLHRATVVQYIPPPYASVTQEPGVLSGQLPQGSAHSPPQYYSVCPLERPAQSRSASLVPSAPSSRRESRNPTGREEEEEEKNEAYDEEALDCVSPPAYEDLYPSLPNDNHT
ncbi:transmembrane protein 174 [Alosa sapidissima]|uniref:transmembrane protein 174 n=1 Tax=Alosa sapidissima TaxID=34773 RepID=UPI001C0A4069|nr:transmembrane protein 174 [Alosa sapidissima]